MEDYKLFFSGIILYWHYGASHQFDPMALEKKKKKHQQKWKWFCRCAFQAHTDASGDFWEKVVADLF